MAAGKLGLLYRGPGGCVWMTKREAEAESQGQPERVKHGLLALDWRWLAGA